MADLETLSIQTRKHFNLELPIKLIDLKKAYRRVSFKSHPDHGGSKEQFIAMQLVYKDLVSMSNRLLGIFEEEGELIQTTTSGISLFELGLGLGPTINGRDCEVCDRKGYELRHGSHYKVCEECDVDGMVPRQLKCRDCCGSGMFTQVHTRRAVVCRLCKGSGKFRHPKLRVVCNVCWGSKTLHTTDNGKVYYEICSKCSGKGEIAIHNPVLPKGALIGRK